jgi:hypothetical protein
MNYCTQEVYCTSGGAVSRYLSKIFSFSNITALGVSASHLAQDQKAGERVEEDSSEAEKVMRGGRIGPPHS